MDEFPILLDVSLTQYATYTELYLEIVLVIVPTDLAVSIVSANFGNHLHYQTDKKKS